MKGGEPDSRWCGREKGASTVWRSAVPKRAEGKRGSGSQEEFGNVWALNRLGEMACIARKAQGGSDALSDKSLKQ